MMGLFRKKTPQATSAPKPDVPEADVTRIVGPPMSHESVLVLARLQGIADRLETAVMRLEQQATEGEDAEDEEDREGGD